MTRKVLEKILKLSVQVFYREVEVLELSPPPKEGGWIVAMNHPNGLVDPLLVLCFCDRPVSFLAKSTIFKIPVLGQLAKALDAIPVYRKQDNVNSANNENTFLIARDKMKLGKAIAIFPEGTSHSETQLKPFKTGAIRLGLGARSESDQPIWIVPVSLFYTAKEVFRSSAVVVWGEAFELPKVTEAEINEGTAVRDLTALLEKRLASIVVQAESLSHLRRFVWAEQIWNWESKKAKRWSPSKTWQFLKEAESNYRLLLSRYPKELVDLEAKIDVFERNLKLHGIEELPNPDLFDLREVRKERSMFLFLMPFGAIGTICFWFPYKIIGWLAPRFAKGEDDIVSTIKLICALLFFPITGIAISSFVFLKLGWQSGLAALLVLPLFAYLTLLWHERGEKILKREQFRSLLARHPEEYRVALEAYDQIRVSMKALLGLLDRPA